MFQARCLFLYYLDVSSPSHVADGCSLDDALHFFLKVCFEILCKVLNIFVSFTCLNTKFRWLITAVNSPTNPTSFFSVVVQCSSLQYTSCGSLVSAGRFRSFVPRKPFCLDLDFLRDAVLIMTTRCHLNINTRFFISSPVEPWRYHGEKKCICVHDSVMPALNLIIVAH